MIDLLMLGLVPGTNIQINFGDWLIGSAVILGIVLILSVIRHRIFMATVILAVILRAEQRKFKILQSWTETYGA